MTLSSLTTARAWRVVFAASILFVSTSSAQAVLIANWSFESTVPTLSNSANFGPLASDFGTGIARGHHADSFTNWSSPTGNGSNHSWLASNWASDDYYQFQISTLALSHITLEWDQTRSSGGPADFKLQWSNDGTTFNDFANYTVLADNNPPTQPQWNSVTGDPVYHFFYDLNAVTAINNKAAVYFRLTAVGNASNVEETVRVDNVNIQVDDRIVPEPSTLALGAVAGLAGLFVAAKRRRTA